MVALLKTKKGVKEMKLVDKDGNKTNLQPGDKIVYELSQCKIAFARGKSKLLISHDGFGGAILDGLVFEMSTNHRFVKLAQIIATISGLELKTSGGWPDRWECGFGKPS